MRRIILLMHVSLDGFVAGPNGEKDWIGYNPNLQPYPYDLNKAKQLLAGRTPEIHIVGTGGRVLYDVGDPAPNSEHIVNETFGILKLTLHPTGYDWQFIPTDPTNPAFHDAGSAPCHAPPQE